MKKLFVILIVACICSVMLSSCANAPKINRKLLPMSVGGGLTYGLYGMDGEIEENKHFQIDSESTFEKIFSFGNLIEYERDYKLLIFSNYKQLQFSVNDMDANSYYDFTTKPNEHTQFKLTFPKIYDGFYDLLFVIVKDPDNINLDEDYRKQTDMSHLITIRYSLQVGTDRVVNEKPTLNTYNTIENQSLDGVFLNKDNDELRRLLSIESKFLEEQELFIHVGNQSDTTKNYLVFFLYDWKQIPIESTDVIYFSLPSMSRTTLPFTLLGSDESGVHNITAICIEEPFEEVSLKSRKADFSIRVGVNVND